MTVKVPRFQVVDRLNQIKDRNAFQRPRNWPPFRRVLMADPLHYRIEYAINPHMTRADGRMQVVDRADARVQWEELRAAYENLGLRVSVMSADEKMPDLVFTANQVFPFWKNARPQVVLSRMAFPERAVEIPRFETWFGAEGYGVHSLQSKGSFEGCGDAILHPNRNLIWGGYGYRTDPEIYDELAELTELNVIRLKILRSDTYHLDTCFSAINESTVAIVPEAFDAGGLECIHAFFPHVLELSDLEAKQFAGNCHSPDGVHVLVQKGVPTFTERLKRSGFQVIELETGEFIKAGGSVFCMKQMIF